MQIEVIYAAIITGIIGPILGFFAKKWYDTWKSKKIDSIKENIKDIAIIEMELHEIREILGADRVWISQFHNGGNFYPTGKSIQKFSVFYEVNAKGIEPIASLFNNIPCSLYPQLFTELMKSNGVKIPTFKGNDIHTYGLRGAAESVSTKSSYIVPLYSLNERYIGNLGIDYVSNEHDMSDTNWLLLLQRASRMSGYLSNYLNKK